MSEPEVAPLSDEELQRIANEQYRSEIIYHDLIEGDRDAEADFERLLATISARDERIRQLEAVLGAALTFYSDDERFDWGSVAALLDSPQEANSD